MVDVLGIPEHTLRWSLNEEYAAHEWDGTRDPLCVIAAALAAEKNVGVESATGTGKSFFAACLVLWFLACWDDARVFTFAPKEDQLRLYIWAEIAKLWPAFSAQFPNAELSDLRIRMDGGDLWGAWGYSVAIRANETSATRAQGMHAPHMLLITEETPGIDPAVMTALGNTCVARHNLRLALGNPDHQLDTLHAFCEKPSVVAVRISAYDHPNVVTDREIVPGATSRAGIANIQEEHEVGSPLCESRTRGISPAQATDALVRREWLDRAAERFVANFRAEVNAPKAKGVDVANSENGDKAAIADYVGSALLALRSFVCPDANVLGRNVKAEMDRDAIPQEHVGVDPIGVGAGTVNELARLGRVVRRLSGAARPVLRAEKAPDGLLYDWAPDANAFNNLRSQMAWQFREDLRLERLMINPEIVKKYAQQFCTATYTVENGKTVVESKDDIKKRTGGKSPDEFDAAIYGNWVRPRKADALPAPAGKTEDKAREYDYAKRQFKPDPQFLDEFERGHSSRKHTRAVRMPRPRV
jgi:phage terminase large subunit